MPDTASVLWRNLMVRQLRRLGGRVQGRLVVEPDPTWEPVPAERFLETDFLLKAIVKGEEQGDVRIAASRWTRQYASGMSAVALTGLARGIGIDVSLPRCAGQSGPNPLRGQLDWVPANGDGIPSKVQTRSLCCLVYLIPARHGRLCENCPLLPVEDRIAFARERRDESQGDAIGPAQQRAIDVGLAKLKRAHKSRAATNSD